ncbi:MAG: hypothetical protein JSV22_12975 [Bacteroidales bacterium]|nr:MAG: hypothetical protein JSV22_12975 [Bacteroidales bacterium]
MSYFKSFIRLGIIILLLFGKSSFPQYILVNSEKVLYENDSVILIIDNGIRGDLQWEVSNDKENWTPVPDGNSGILHIHVDSSVYYRAKITEGTCTYIYSDTVLIAELYDERDDHVYDIVRIGQQWWMAENLDYFSSYGSWYYNNDSVSNSIYGRLYNWETAQSVCPAEWHLPSDEEWKILEMEIGMSEAQAVAIGLRGTDEGTQLKIGGTSGFDIIYSGFRDPSGTFISLGSGATFWTSTEGGAGMAWYRGFATDPQIHRDVYDKEYGFSVRCVRQMLPVVNTIPVDSVGITYARSGGTITDEGASTVTARGVCWSTSPDPVVSTGNYTVDGTGTGEFTSIITGLQINTTYYLRAYATNSKGTGYGKQEIFETLPLNETGTVTDSRDGKTYKTVKIGYQWWMAENLNYNTSNSWCYDDLITNCNSSGLLYSWSAAQNACPANWHLPGDDEWKILEMALGMSQAEADNTGLRGTDQGTQLKEEGSTGFDILYAGYRDPEGIFSSYGSGATFWTSTEEAVSTAWYRGFATDPQIHRDIFDKDYGFSVRCVLDILPEVTTNSVDSIGKTYARCGGNVISDGGLPVTERGVCWSTSHNPDIGDSHTSDGAGLGEFTSIMTGLIRNRRYYVRAYATSSGGTAYGEEVSFVTKRK